MEDKMYTPIESSMRLGGPRERYAFPNGYGASVIRNQYSYGNEDGLFELAVLDSSGHLTYDTPITDDVIGYLTAEQVQEQLAKIAALPPNESTTGGRRTGRNAFGHDAPAVMRVDHNPLDASSDV
jgi:hypothetical protein